MKDGEKGIFERPPGSGTWWVRYKDHHCREHREKVGPKGLAVKVYAKRVAQVAEAKFFPEKEIRVRQVSFKDFLKDFVRDHVAGKLKNEDHERRYAKVWTDALGSRPVRTITKDDVARYVSRRQEQVSSASINRELAFLRKAMSHAVQKQLADANPVGARNGGVKLFRENNQRVRWLTDDQEARLRQAIAERRWPAVAFALNTGFRQANQFNLQWQDVNFDAGAITARNPKGGTDYSVPMNATVRDLLRTLPSRLKSRYVFPSSSGSTPMGSQNFMNRVFVPALRKAKIEDFHWHDLRHTFASRLVTAGVPLLTVSKLLGHKTLAMTLRYAHLAPGHLLDAVRQLDSSGTRSGTRTRHSKVPPRGTSVAR